MKELPTQRVLSNPILLQTLLGKTQFDIFITSKSITSNLKHGLNNIFLQDLTQLINYVYI